MDSNEKNKVEQYKKLLIERDESFNAYRNNFLLELSDIEDVLKKNDYIKNKLTEHYKDKSLALLEYFNSTSPEQRVDDKNINIIIEMYNAILNFIEKEKEDNDKIISLEEKDKSKNNLSKIKCNCTPSVFGYLFFDLANKGYFDFPLHNGEINPTGLAKQLFEVFEINSTIGTLINEFNLGKQSLSEIKKAKFSIPQIDDLK